MGIKKLVGLGAFGLGLVPAMTTAQQAATTGLDVTASVPSDFRAER